MNRITARVVERYKEATEFPTEDAKRKYLRDHPDADPRNHTVKSPANHPGGRKDVPGGNDLRDPRKRNKLIKEYAAGNTAKKLEKMLNQVENKQPKNDGEQREIQDQIRFLNDAIKEVGKK